MTASSEDQRRWDKKYARSHPYGSSQPDADLIKYIGKVPDSGLALDIACGSGRNSIFLARHGLDVVCMDISTRALETLQSSAGDNPIAKKLYPVQADLTHTTLPSAGFDVVTVIRYLDRRAFSAYLQTLKTGGLLFIKTFNRNHLTRVPGFNPDYLVTPGELTRQFRGSDILHTNDDPKMEALESFILLSKR